MKMFRFISTYAKIVLWIGKHLVEPTQKGKQMEIVYENQQKHTCTWVPLSSLEVIDDVLSTFFPFEWTLTFALSELFPWASNWFPLFWIIWEAPLEFVLETPPSLTLASSS